MAAETPAERKATDFHEPRFSTHLFVNHHLTRCGSIASGTPEFRWWRFSARASTWTTTTRAGETNWATGFAIPSSSSTPCTRRCTPMTCGAAPGHSGDQYYGACKVQAPAWVDEIKRALEVAETIPFRYLIQHLGVSGEEFDERKVDAAFVALEEDQLCAPARSGGVAREHAQRPSQRRAAALLFRADAPGPGLSRPRPRQHEGRRGDGVQAAERRAFVRHMFTTIMGKRTRTCFRSSPRVEALTGLAP